MSSTARGGSPLKIDKLGDPPSGFKPSIYTLTTTPMLEKSIIVYFTKTLPF
jgi:hypothetical protein